MQSAGKPGYHVGMQRDATAEAGDAAVVRYPRAAALREWLRPPRELKTTSLGKIMIVFTILIGVAAINTGNNLLYLILGGLFGLIAASGVLSERVLRGVTAVIEPPPVLVAGRPASVSVRLSVDARAPAFLLDLALQDEARRRWGRGPLREIGAGDTRRVAVTWQPERRGGIRVAAVSISTRFPFQMYEKTRVITAPATLWVAPAPTAVSLPPQRAGSQASARRLPRRGGEDEFKGLRERVPTDPPSRIHWRRSATVGRHLTKEFTAEIDVGFRLELRAGNDDVEFEAALAEAAGWLEAAVRAERSLDLVIGADVQALSGPEGWLRGMLTLARLRRSETPPGVPALHVERRA